MYEDLGRPPLSEQSLRRFLVGGPVGRYAALDVVDETGSTNADLLSRAATAADRTVLLAEHQTAGRGRLGRTWTAPPRSQVACSVLLRPGAIPPILYGWLPLVTGLALRDALADVGGVDASLKWPNDVLVGGKKVAGILVEATSVRTDGDFVLTLPALVVGFGLNVSLTEDELPVPQATSLALEGGNTDRGTLTTGVLRALADRHEQWRASDRGSGSSIDPAVAAEYNEACSTIGTELAVTMPAGDVVEGIGDHVDAEGRLVVRTHVDGSLVRVAAGDVTHVRPAGGQGGRSGGRGGGD